MDMLAAYREVGSYRGAVAMRGTTHKTVELPLIRKLLDSGSWSCAGGRGMLVIADPAGQRSGVDAVIDKDLTASLLAREVDVDILLLLTDVDAVIDGFGSPAPGRSGTHHRSGDHGVADYFAPPAERLLWQVCSGGSRHQPCGSSRSARSNRCRMS